MSPRVISICSFVAGLAMLFMFVAYIMMGCHKQQQKQAVVIPANIAIVALAEAYRREGLHCIDKATGRVEAEVCIAHNENQWAKVWALWDIYRSMPDRVEAFCAFLRSVPKGVAVPPAALGVCHDDGF